MKKCSISLAIKEMEIKATLRFHITPVRNSYHQKHTQQMLVRMWGERNPHILLVGIKISTTTMVNSMKILRKLKIELPYDPAILLLRIYLKKI
jgi:hypothetical protein